LQPSQQRPLDSLLPDFQNISKRPDGRFQHNLKARLPHRLTSLHLCTESLISANSFSLDGSSLSGG
jgi:hypothetical protein